MGDGLVEEHSITVAATEGLVDPMLPERFERQWNAERIPRVRPHHSEYNDLIIFAGISNIAMSTK